MSSDGPTAADFATKLKGLDSSQVEVDDEQVAPSVAANSPEEAALLAELEAALTAAGDQRCIDAPQDVKLRCLRGRKYEVARAAELLPKHLNLLSELQLDRADNEQLKADLKTHKLVSLGSKDKDGRAVLWIRLRFHDPKVSKAPDMGRLIVTVMLEALKDVDAQRQGLCIINDMTGISLKNLDPSLPKFLFGTVFPNMPIRVGRVCLFHPPWFIGHVILPIVFTFLSKKLKARIAILNGSDHKKLDPYVAPESRPAGLGGTLAFEDEAWGTKMAAALGGAEVAIS